MKPAAIVLGGLLVLIFGFWLSRRRYRASVREAAAAMNRSAGGGDA